MTGRGKGKKGLGKGGALRHSRQFKDQVYRAYTKGALRRLARRGGVKRLSGTLYEEMRVAAKGFVQQILYDAIQYMQSRERVGKDQNIVSGKTLSIRDVVMALQRNNKMLYGYVDTLK